MNAIVGTQMYPWSQHYQALGQNWNDHLDEILAQVADAGLAAWEQSMTTQADADRLRGLLEKHHLKLASIYAGGALHPPEWRKAADEILRQAALAKALGAQVVVVNPDPIG